jgi:hypothetical protein
MEARAAIMKATNEAMQLSMVKMSQESKLRFNFLQVFTLLNKCDI